MKYGQKYSKIYGILLLKISCCIAVMGSGMHTSGPYTRPHGCGGRPCRPCSRLLLTTPGWHSTVDSMITLERTIEVPANRRVFFDLPLSVPQGRTSVVLVFPDREQQREAEGDDEVDETEYLLRSPANREYLLQAIDDVRHGRNLVAVPAETFLV